MYSAEKQNDLGIHVRVLHTSALIRSVSRIGQRGRDDKIDPREFSHHRSGHYNNCCGFGYVEELDTGPATRIPQFR